MDKKNEPKQEQQEERLVVIGKASGKKKPVDEPGKVYYPAFTWRMFASTIDVLLTTILIIPVIAFFVPTFNNPEAIELLQKSNNGQLSEEEFAAEFINLMVHGGGLMHIGLSLLFEFVLMGFVVMLFWKWRGATPGKILLGMKIVDEKTNGEPTTKQLIIRYLAYMVSILPGGLGFLWVIVNKKRRAWHDYLSGTAVVYKKKPRFLI